MDRSSKYILNNFFTLFSSLFFTLFFMVSVIFFVNISQLTSLFKVTFIDLLQLYIFLLPQILVYTLPITFFISIAISTYKMSKDNEAIVLFALGQSPSIFAKLFFFVSLLISIFLLISSLIFMPLANQLYHNFIEQKKTEAKLNIKATEFGQKFSNWNVFINRSQKEGYSDVILYNKAKEQNATDNFIIAKGAKITQSADAIEFKLKEGRVFSIKTDEIIQSNFGSMNIRYTPKIIDFKTDTLIEYWLEAKTNTPRAKQLSFHILISIFPLATFLFALSFGIVHTRIKKSNIYFSLFVVVVSYYLLIYQASSKIPFIGIGAIFGLFFTISMLFFREKILKRY